MDNIIKFLSDESKPIVVCDDLNFIYIRNSRTASTSLYRNLLQKQLKLRTLNSREEPKKFRQWINNLTESKWHNYFTFSGIRNPWDRITSVYFYIVKDRYKISFEQYIKNITKYDKDENLYAHRIPCTNHTHYNGEQIVDFTYRYENINKDFAYVAKKLKLNSVKLPHVNKTNHAHYRRYFNQEMKNIIAELFKNDIEAFGYRY